MLTLDNHPQLKYEMKPCRCPICCGPAQQIYCNSAQRRINACKECGHAFVGNPWSDEELLLIYERPQYFDMNYTHQGIHSLETDGEWCGWLGHRLSQIDRLGLLAEFKEGGARILEVGCLEGRILNELKKRGHEVFGCDLNKEICSRGRKLFNVDIRIGELTQCGFASSFFDLIYSFHTIEHLPDPRGYLRNCLSLLRPNGLLFFEIPMNETDYENKDHLHFFSDRSLDIMMKSFVLGYQVEKNAFGNANGMKIESVLVTARRNNS